MYIVDNEGKRIEIDNIPSIISIDKLYGRQVIIKSHALRTKGVFIGVDLTKTYPHAYVMDEKGTVHYEYLDNVLFIEIKDLFPDIL